MISLVCVCVQGGADRKGSAGPAVAVREPDGAGGGEEICSGEQCQTDRGQVGLGSRRVPSVSNFCTNSQ